MKKRPLHNRSDLKSIRRKLRRALTPAEARLWTYLKNGQVCGRKFRRQHSVGPHVLDFYCPAEKLAIELDGESHTGPIAAAKDAERTAYLKEQGIRVLRFENQVVWDMPKALLARIRENFRHQSEVVPWWQNCGMRCSDGARAPSMFAFPTCFDPTVVGSLQLVTPTLIRSGDTIVTPTRWW